MVRNDATAKSAKEPGRSLSYCPKWNYLGQSFPNQGPRGDITGVAKSTTILSVVYEQRGNVIFARKVNAWRAHYQRNLVIKSSDQEVCGLLKFAESLEIGSYG